MAKRVMAMLGMLTLLLATAAPAFAQGVSPQYPQGVSPQYQYGGGAGGEVTDRSASLAFELTVECEPPASATFFGNVQTGEGGPGIFAQLLDPDGDGIYTGVATLGDRFAPGPAPPGTEPVALTVQVLQGTGTRSVPAGTLPGEPTTVIRDFGAVPIQAENVFSASVSFCDGTTPIGTPQLPATGGPLPVAVALGAALLAGGLISRRLIR